MVLLSVRWSQSVRRRRERRAGGAERPSIGEAGAAEARGPGSVDRLHCQ